MLAPKVGNSLVLHDLWILFGNNGNTGSITVIKPKTSGKGSKAKEVFEIQENFSIDLGISCVCQSSKLAGILLIGTIQGYLIPY